MTVEQIELRVARIAAVRDDDEVAHSLEDALRDDVLKAIAAGAPEAHQLAAAALKTGNIKFARWCA